MVPVPTLMPMPIGLIMARALGVAVPTPTLPGNLSTKLVMMVRRLKRCLQCWQETAGGSCLTSLGDDGDDDGDGIDDDDACLCCSRIALFAGLARPMPPSLRCAASVQPVVRAAGFR